MPTALGGSLGAQRGSNDSTPGVVSNALLGSSLRSGATSGTPSPTPDPGTTAAPISPNSNPGNIPGMPGYQAPNWGGAPTNIPPAPGVQTPQTPATPGYSPEITQNDKNNAAPQAQQPSTPAQSSSTFTPTFAPSVDWSYNNGGFGQTQNQQVNPNYFADQATSNTVAQALGGKVVTAPGTSTSSPMLMIQLPNGSYINAGDAANMVKSYGGNLNNPDYINAMNNMGRSESQVAGMFSNLQGAYVPGVDNSDPTGEKAKQYTAVQSLYGGNPNLVNGGTAYAGAGNEALSNQLAALLGGNGTYNGHGNGFNPTISGSGGSTSFYGQPTTTPLGETNNTNPTPQNTQSVSPQLMQLLQLLLSGGQSNTASLSGLQNNRIGQL